MMTVFHIVPWTAFNIFLWPYFLFIILLFYIPLPTPTIHPRTSLAGAKWDPKPHGPDKVPLSLPSNPISIISLKLMTSRLLWLLHMFFSATKWSPQLPGYPSTANSSSLELLDTSSLMSVQLLNSIHSSLWNSLLAISKIPHILYLFSMFLPQLLKSDFSGSPPK